MFLEAPPKPHSLMCYDWFNQEHCLSFQESETEREEVITLLGLTSSFGH